MRIFCISLLAVICFFPVSAFGDCVMGDCENGEGVMMHPDGSKYVGQFKDGVPHGQGTLSEAESKKVGNVSYSCSKCGIYEGPFNKGVKEGKGTLTFYNGRKYVGEFKDDQMEGEGTMIFPKNAKYVGQFKDGKMNGKGVMTNADGSQYKGGFKDGKTFTGTGESFTFG